MNITQPLCAFVALGILHAMACAILSSVQYFSTLTLLNGTIFEKKSH